MERTLTNEPPHDKTNKMAVPNENLDQTGLLSSLIRAFAEHSVGS